MMGRRTRAGAGGAALLAALLLGGGAGALAAEAAQGPPPEAPSMAWEIPPDPFAGLAERFRRLAQKDEASKDWLRALMRWEAVAAVDPQDRASRQRISAIRKLLKENGDRHFTLAKEALRKEQFAKAFREFLRTLSYDPGNAYALTMVKHELNAKSVNEYTVKRGDSLRAIAESEYGDGDLTFLVQYYNDIRNPRLLDVGQVLKIPVVAGVVLAEPPERKQAAPAKRPARPKAPARPEPGRAPEAVAKAAPEPKAEPAPEPAPAAVVEAPSQAAGASIVAAEVRTSPQAGSEYDSQQANTGAAQANRLLQAGQYEEAAAAAEAVLDDDPINAQAREVFNAAYYGQGKQLRDRQQPVAAMQVLARVDPGYKDVGAIVASMREGLSGQDAEVRYIAGVTAFLEEDLNGAIREWELTLKLDPKHPQATKDLENARALQAKLAAVQ
jgi:tetratricopeptide (TPR) repeat protein